MSLLYHIFVSIKFLAFSPNWLLVSTARGRIIMMAMVFFDGDTRKTCVKLAEEREIAKKWYSAGARLPGRVATVFLKPAC
jgi:hypothetical protein